MKSIAIPLVITTTLILITTIVFALGGIPFSWIFYLTLNGQVFLFFTVYKVLTDNYSTHKTFEDFYEDHPVSHEKYHS